MRRGTVTYGATRGRIEGEGGEKADLAWLLCRAELELNGLCHDLAVGSR